MKKLSELLNGHVGFIVVLYAACCSCGNSTKSADADVDEGAEVGEAPEVGEVEDVNGEINQDLPASLARLRAQGSLIQNESGETVHLTGVGIQQFMAGSRIGPWYSPDENGSTQDREYVANFFTEIKNSGANHVRISIKLLEKWFNEGEYPEYKPNLDMCVEEAARVDLYIYFCFHYGSHSDDGLMQALIENGEWDRWPGVRDAWMENAQDIASRYKDYPQVLGYQNWAEPGWARFGRDHLDMEGDPASYEILSEEWAAFNLDVAGEIHSVNPDALIFVTSPGYYRYKNVCDYYYNNPLDEQNIVYAWQDYHRYQEGRPFWTSYSNGDFSTAKQGHEEWLVGIALRMIERGHPVHLVEFGFTKDFSEAAFESTMAQDMYDIFKSYNQGWTQFCWGSGDSEWYLLDNEGNLTESGELMSQNFTPLP